MGQESTVLNFLEFQKLLLISKMTAADAVTASDHIPESLVTHLLQAMLTMIVALPFILSMSRAKHLSNT